MFASVIHKINWVVLTLLFVPTTARRIACSRRSDSGARVKIKASEEWEKNDGRLEKGTRERL